jgi:hypothetical protein
MKLIPFSPLLSPGSYLGLVVLGGGSAALYWSLYWAIATSVAWSLTALGCTLLGNWWNRSNFYFATAVFLYYGVYFLVSIYAAEQKQLARRVLLGTP